jgi:hypothetical protein
MWPDRVAYREQGATVREGFVRQAWLAHDRYARRVQRALMCDTPRSVGPRRGCAAYAQSCDHAQLAPLVDPARLSVWLNPSSMPSSRLHGAHLERPPRAWLRMLAGHEQQS